MLIRVALLISLLCCALLAQDPPKGKCSTCNGQKQVKCFSCDGKTGSQVACPACPDGGFPCPGCQGAGTLMCISCGGGGKAGGDQLKCCTCGGGGKLDCLLCDKGNVPCTRCKGSGKVSMECPTCAKSGHLRCPECSGYATAAKCPPCGGSKQEKCPGCAGQGELPKPCDVCKGHGKQPCGTCYGHGKQSCTQCLGGGKYHKSGDARENVMDKCDQCGTKGCQPCATCKGKGLEKCAQCQGKGGAKAPCWWCAGAKSIPCRRCAGETRYWTGKHEASGVVVTVLPCQDLEPQFSLGLKDSAGLTDYRVWRVILDGREGAAPFQLGGADGFALIGVSPSSTEVATLDTASLFAPETIASLERKLPSWGGHADAFQAPVKVQPKTVEVRFVVSDRSLGTDATVFRLRLNTDSSQVSELEAKPLTVDAWIAICAGAAKAAK